MALTDPKAKLPTDLLAHKTLKGPRSSPIDLPSRDISKTTNYSFAPPTPVPSANTGKVSKFTSKSPLVTTMGSSKVK